MHQQGGVSDGKKGRIYFKKILRRHDYEMLEAENGEKALNISEIHKEPIYLLKDVVMPRLNRTNLSGICNLR